MARAAAKAQARTREFFDRLRGRAPRPKAPK